MEIAVYKELLESEEDRLGIVIYESKLLFFLFPECDGPVFHFQVSARVPVVRPGRATSPPAPAGPAPQSRQS